MPYTVDSLEIKVQEKSAQAKGNLDRLIDTLRALKAACRNGAGLNEVANALDKISRINTKSIKSVNDASNAIKKTTAEVKDAVTELNEGLGKINTDGFDNIDNDVSQIKKSVNDSSKEIKRSFGDAVKEMIKQTAQAHPAITKFIKSLGRVAFYRAIRSAMKTAMDAIKEGYENAYQFSRIMDGDFSKSVDSVTSQFRQFKNQVGSIFSELFQSVQPFLEKLIQKLYDFANTFSQVFAILNGKTIYKQAQLTSDHWKDATKSAKAYKSAVLGIDELNVINPNEGGGASDAKNYGEMFKYANVELGKLQKPVEWLRDNLSIAKDLAIAIATAFGSAKLLKGITGIAKLMGGLKDVNVGKISAGLSMSITGFTIEFMGGMNIAKEGATAKNIIQTALGGAFGIIGGLVAFGPGSLLVTIPLAITIPIVGYMLGTKQNGIKKFYDSPAYQELLALDEEISKTIGITQEVGIEFKARQDSFTQLKDDATTAKLLIDTIFELDEKRKSGMELAESEIAQIREGAVKLGELGIQLDLDPEGRILNTKEEIMETTAEMIKAQIVTSAARDLIESTIGLSKEQRNFATNVEPLWRSTNEELEAAQQQLDTYKAQRDFFLDGDIFKFFDALINGNLKAANEKYHEQAEKVKGLRTRTEELDEEYKTSTERIQSLQDEQGFYNGILDNTGGMLDNLMTQLGYTCDSYGEYVESVKKAISITDDFKKSLSLDGNGGRTNINSSLGVNIPFGGMKADGGVFPSNGQLFIANEAGPEMVASWGNQTGVANGNQIVSGIQQGVSSAVTSALAPYLAQIANNTRETANKDFSVNIGDRDIARANARGQRAMGVNLITVG